MDRHARADRRLRTHAERLASRDGYFAPESVIRRVGNSPITPFLGGGAAVLLQVAHPLVAVGVVQHSDYRNDLWRRLARTLRALYLIAYGTKAEADRAGELVRAVHAHVRGTTRSRLGRFPPGTHYSACDPELMLWVHATLVEASLAAYQRFVHPLARPGASSTILGTGGGPANWSTTYWRACEDGQGLHFPLFIPANARPGRDDVWLEAKRRTMTRNAFRVEYALTPEDALEGIGKYVFAAEDIDLSDMRTLATTRGRKYFCQRHSEKWRTTNMHDRCPKCGARVQPVPFLLSWAVAGAGAGADASVGTVLDLASYGTYVAEQRRFVGIPFAQLQREIEKLAFEYFGAKTAVEMNGLGAAIVGNVEIPKHRLIEWWTTERSKDCMIGGIQLALENGELKFDHDACPELAKELRGYQTPDTFCQTDTVMSLGVGLACAGEAYVKPGRVLSVIQVDAYGS